MTDVENAAKNTHFQMNDADNIQVVCYDQADSHMIIVHPIRFGMTL